MYKILSAACACFLLLACHAMAADVPTEEQIARGHDAAINLCSACHIVSRDQPHMPVLKIVPPFFFEIANNPRTTPESIRKFLEATHWDFKTRPITMPATQLDEEQKKAIIAYIMSMRR